MSHIFHRQPQDSLPYAVAGDGPYVIDSAGKRYLDASGGAAVSCLGHNHPVVIDAIKQQIDRVAYAHSAFFTTDVAEQLADGLVANAPPGINHVYFVTGGSEAMEAALKLARQYFVERGQPGRRHFIARRQSYHGNTLGALAVGGNAWRREPFRPLLAESHHIAPCYAYRDRLDDETEQQYGLRVANELEHTIQTLGAETVIGFIAEPVVGATLGAVPAVPGYFRRIHEICDRYGVLLILDEVMCGMGRTGTLFACEHDGISADLIVIAKGLGAGYQPIGAMLVSDQIYQTVCSGSGYFQHGHTYMAHPTACAAALAVQNVVRDDNLLENVERIGHRLSDELHRALGQHPYVGDIRGRGLFIGLELVNDRDSKTPFAPSLALHRSIKRTAMEFGLMCYPMGGTIDGQRGNHILLAPPFTIGQTHVDEIVGIITRTVDDVTTQAANSPE